MAKRGKAGQQELVFRTWGGRREGAGRKARAERAGFLAHVARPRHDARTPVHVTMRAARAPSLRSERVFAVVRREIAAASRRGVRVLHFSVQRDHVHMIVEVDGGAAALARGVQRLASRVAQEVNRVVGRVGKLWRDRYHRHDLATPRAVRNALAYVLFNARKHAAARLGVRVRGARHLEAVARALGFAFDGDLSALDARSSARWFDGWSPRAGPPPAALASPGEPSPVVPPRTWLARTGWKRRGLLRADEVPGP